MMAVVMMLLHLMYFNGDWREFAVSSEWYALLERGKCYLDEVSTTSGKWKL